MADNVDDFAAWAAESEPPQGEPKAEVKQEEPSVAPEPEKEPEAESAEDSDPSDDRDEPEDSPKSKPGRRERAITNRDRKIGELAAEKAALAREKEELARRISELERSAPRGETPSAAKQWDGKSEPREENYDDYSKYIKDLGRWGYIQEREAEKAEKESSQKAERAKTFTERLNEGRRKYEDFDEVALNPNAPASEAMINAIVEHPKSEDIAYYLGKNPAEAQRIAELIPAAAKREIGKIAEQLTKPASDSPKPKPKPGPPPPTNVANGLSAKSVFDASTFEGWLSATGAK